MVPEIRWYFGDGQRDPQWEQCVEHNYNELCMAVCEIRWYFGDGQRDPQWEQCVEHSYNELCKAVCEILCLK